MKFGILPLQIRSQLLQRLKLSWRTWMSVLGRPLALLWLWRANLFPTYSGLRFLSIFKLLKSKRSYVGHFLLYIFKEPLLKLRAFAFRMTSCCRRAAITRLCTMIMNAPWWSLTLVRKTPVFTPALLGTWQDLCPVKLNSPFMKVRGQQQKKQQL